MKTCSRCKVVKTLDSFGKSKRYAGGIFCWCRSCVAEYGRAKYSENPEKFRERERIYAKKNRAKCSERRQRWAEENRDRARKVDRARYWRDREKRIRLAVRIAAANRGPRNEASRRWAAKNPENRRLHSRVDGAIRRAAVPSWADMKKIRAIYEEARRLEIITGIPHHVDHIIPIKGKNVCGLHCEANLQILTAVENLKKRNHYSEDAANGR